MLEFLNNISWLDHGIIFLYFFFFFFPSLAGWSSEGLYKDDVGDRTAEVSGLCSSSQHAAGVYRGCHWGQGACVCVCVCVRWDSSESKSMSAPQPCSLNQPAAKPVTLPSQHTHTLTHSEREREVDVCVCVWAEWEIRPKKCLCEREKKRMKGLDSTKGGEGERVDFLGRVHSFL